MSEIFDEYNNSRVMVLPDELANQIAAGEVVERPMSVVKELLDNSIDAKATRILIEINNGGKTLISVTDNGSGMSSSDAQLAFSRHATSKISSAADLERIVSLGFRGEALPSIASVSQINMITSENDSGGGTQINIGAGGPIQVKESACRRGTTIKVSQLFYNIPARKKFLKSDSTETSHITQVVTQHALAYPHIHFTLINNERKVIEVLPTDQHLYRIAELFGGQLVKELVQVDAESSDYRLTGYISSPVYTRSSRSAQYCYVNQRFVRDKVIFHSTQHGYSHLIPKGQHPVIYLFLTMDPKLYDVNVHPAKAEVRFAFQQEVHSFISRAIKNALGGSEKIPLSSMHKTSKTSNTLQTSLPKVEIKGKSINVPSTSRNLFSQDLSTGLDLLYKNSPPSSTLMSQVQICDSKPTPLSNLIYSEFEPLGQLDGSFILMQGKLGILIVDQHIAHERILYERFSKAAKNRKIEVQRLLFPLTLEFSPSETELLTNYKDHLGEFGLELEPFGDRGFLLRSVPAILKNNNHEKIMREIVDMLPTQKHIDTLNEKLEEILVMMSCRNAIKINTILGIDQIRKLIADLEATDMPYTCPHGRPIALLYEMDSILKKFLRK